MSELQRFDDAVWDRLFASLYPREPSLSDEEVAEELRRLGVGVQGTVYRVRAAFRARREGAVEGPPGTGAPSPQPPAPTPPPAFQPLAVGAAVVKRGDRSACGSITAPPRRIQGEDWYPVRFGVRIENVRAQDLEAFAGEQDLNSLLQARSFASHAAFARRMTLSKLRRPLRDAIYSLESSRTEFHPHQFRPLLKFLESERGRLLIADEVGLGKTIEAGFILQEQRARHAIDRVLVICPASLRTKWQRELWGRFREEFEVLNSDGFRSKVLDRRQDGQHRKRLQAIVSIQTLRSSSLLQRIEETAPLFDLVIVDEAHHCRNSDTKQHRAVRALTGDADAVIFLTATPLHIRNENLFNLLRLLLPEEFDRLDVFEQRLELNRHIVTAETHVRRIDREGFALARRSLENLRQTREGLRVTNGALFKEVCRLLDETDPVDRPAVIELQDALSKLNLLSHVMTRTRKREVHAGSARRQAHVVRVDMTEHERDVYHRLSQYCFDRYTASGDDFSARFAVITLQRQLASSVHAALDYYGELIEAGGGDGRAPVDSEIETFEDDLDDAPDAGAAGAARQRLVDDPQFRALMRECGSRSTGERDSKLEELCKLLANKDKVVLFSYFKRSLRYLERELTKRGIGCARIDGDVPTNPQDPDEDERLRRIDAFRDREAIKVLLSSEVGSEGLDFQFCHTLVNWDLPWNPMVVEQRIGRLDRLGQRSEHVLVFNFSAPDTIEDRILDRLYERVGLFEGAIGALEPILGQKIKQLTEQLFDARLTPEQRERIIEEAAAVLERRLKEERELDAASAALLGQDEIFAQHLDQAKRLGRYVTPEESRFFVSDFLADEIPESGLKPIAYGGSSGRQAGAAPDLWRLPVTPGLRRFLQANLTPDDIGLQRFLERCAAPELAVTFLSEVALGNQGVEFVNAQHPLVCAISRFYAGKSDRIHAACAVQVESDAVAAGDYFFTWARVNETGLQAGTSLWAEAFSVNGEIHLEPDETELLLHRMVVNGKAFENFEAPPAALVDALFKACEDALYGRVIARQAEATKLNGARVETRLASLQASYEVRHAETQRRLETARAGGNARIVSLFEAQLRTKDSTYRHKRQEIEARRVVSVTPENPDGAGFVRVLAPRPPTNGDVR